MTPEERQLILDQEFDAIYKQARREVIRTAVRRKIAADIAADTVTDPHLKYAVEQLGREAFVKPKKEPGLWLITIGAKDGVDPVAFFKQMEKCVQKKGLTGKGQYAIEQRAEAGQEPYGWHIHWILEAAEYRSKSVRAQLVYQCFMKYLAAPNYVDVRPITRTPECVVAYIEGTKKDEGKWAKAEYDKVVRARHNIPPKISY